MLIFAKVLLRQIKTRLLVLFQLIKRLFCCFRNKTDANFTTEHENEIIVSNFVIVQQNEQFSTNTMTNIYDQETSLDEWDAMASDSVGSTRQQNASYSFSNFSFVNQKNEPQFSTNNIGSKIDIGPNQISYDYQSKLKNSTNNEQEPDFFQDMTPKLKKPKKIFVAKDTEVCQNEITKKFNVNNCNILELDDSKFKPFGLLEESNSLKVKNQNCNTSWEDMALEETSWNELDASLQEMRREKRQQKLREHQEQRRFKQQNQ